MARGKLIHSTKCESRPSSANDTDTEEIFSLNKLV